MGAGSSTGRARPQTRHPPTATRGRGPAPPRPASAGWSSSTPPGGPSPSRPTAPTPAMRRPSRRPRKSSNPAPEPESPAQRPRVETVQACACTGRPACVLSPRARDARVARQGNWGLDLADRWLLIEEMISELGSVYALEVEAATFPELASEPALQ